MVKYRLKDGNEIYLDGYEIAQYDSIVHNIKKDWDFCGIVSGDRMVRVGKTVKAMSICAYLADRLGTRYSLDDIYFDSQAMIEAAKQKPPFSVNHYDEAREGLAAIKSMQRVQQDLMDFFNECGQLNQIFILVLPDFFTLKEEIAVGRSEFLVNVYRHSENKFMDLYHDGIKRPVVQFHRGRFQFFSRNKKMQLYDKYIKTRLKNYHSVAPDFIGNFPNNYPIPEDLYREKKRLAFVDSEKKRESKKHVRTDFFRNRFIYKLSKELPSAAKISEYLEEELQCKLGRDRIIEIIAAEKDREAMEEKSDE